MKFRIISSIAVIAIVLGLYVVSVETETQPNITPVKQESGNSAKGFSIN